MKFLIILSLTLATALALPNKEVKNRNIIVPAGIPGGRITQGRNAWKGQFPYQVGLSQTLKNGRTTWCGGSLINNAKVLTAAHCTEDAVKVEVRLGAISRHKPEVSYIVYPQDIVIHEEYNTETMENDISLITIPYTRYTATIQPVYLPTKSGAYSSYAGETAVASGWGRIFQNAGGPHPFLQFARLTIISNKFCQKYFDFEIEPTNICVATSEGASTCKGDSGGPLVLESSKILVGVTSFISDDGCEKRYPAVFTRVSSYLKWIEQNSS